MGDMWGDDPAETYLRVTRSMGTIEIVEARCRRRLAEAVDAAQTLADLKPVLAEILDRLYGVDHIKTARAVTGEPFVVTPGVVREPDET